MMSSPSLRKPAGSLANCQIVGFKLVVALGLAVLVAACAEGASDKEFASGNEPIEAAAQSTSEQPTQTATSDGSADGPKTLADYVGNAAPGGGGQRGGGFGGDTDELIDQQRRVQQAIQVCMQGQGFEYVPEEVGDGLQIFLATQNQGVNPADYAETEGFGISTRFDVLLEGDVDLEESVEPNEEHLASLSEGEADAWNLALNGAPPERNAEGQLIDPETGEVIGGAGRGQATGGCRLEAQTEVRGVTAALGELEDELVLLSDRIDADPRITEIRRAWVDCMREEGFDYADETEARADINAQVRPLLRSFFTSGENDGDGGGDGQGRGPGGGNLLQAVAGLQLTPEQDVELEALQDLERAIAVASLQCQGDTAQEVAEITARYEAEFIEANRSALEALTS